MSRLGTDAELEGLIHDVNGKCVSLKDATALLRKVSGAEADELLALMAEQAGDLAQIISEYKERRKSQ